MDHHQSMWGQGNIWAGLPVASAEPGETKSGILQQWSATNLGRHWLSGRRTAGGASTDVPIYASMGQPQPGRRPREPTGAGEAPQTTINAIASMPDISRRMSGHSESSKPGRLHHRYSLETTNMVRVRDGVVPALTAHEVQERMRAGVSTAYRGHPTRPRNVSADIPDDENCAFWITGLPPTCTVKMLLSAISGFGKIYATHINPPDGRLPFGTAAAKVILFRLSAARAFFREYEFKPLLVDGFLAIVRRNRIRAAKLDRKSSRVLVITGPKEVVDWGYLQGAFRNRFVYDLDEVVTLWENGELRSLEVRFGSARAQAEAAYQLLRPTAGPFANVGVWYGHDPCDPEAH